MFEDIEQEIVHPSPDRRPVGRPPKPVDAHVVMRKEIVELVQLAQRTRKFAGDQLIKLEKDAEGITNIKQRIEVAKTAVQLLDQLTKTAKSLIVEIKDEQRPDAEGQSALASIMEDLGR